LIPTSLDQYILIKELAIKKWFGGRLKNFNQSISKALSVAFHFHFR
jgi:hypothetical protein